MYYILVFKQDLVSRRNTPAAQIEFLNFICAFINCQRVFLPCYVISLLEIKTGVRSVNKFCRGGKKEIKTDPARPRVCSLTTRVKNIERTLNNEQRRSEMPGDFPRRKLAPRALCDIYCARMFSAKSR